MRHSLNLEELTEIIHCKYIQIKNNKTQKEEQVFFCISVIISMPEVKTA